MPDLRKATGKSDILSAALIIATTSSRLIN